MKLRHSCAPACSLVRSPARRAGVTDAQIAAIVVTANQVDIDAGKLRQPMASNGDVKKFGRRMVTDHTGVNNPRPLW